MTPPHFLLSLPALAALILLPGIATTLLMVSGQHRDWWARWRTAVWLIPLPAGFLIISIIMEALVLTGFLSLGRVAVIAGIYTVLAALYLCLNSGREPIRQWRLSSSKRSVLTPLILLILYMSITVYPFDFIFDTTDCGVYVVSGVNAFKNGSFRYIDPEIADASKDFQKAFYHVTPPEHYGSAKAFRFEGMLGAGHFIRSFETGLIEPRYFNLHPLWIGLFVSLCGLVPGAWLATPFLALCGISGIFLLAWALAGRRSAIFSLSLLSVFVLQVWFGRYITTEVAFQAAAMNALAWWLIFSRHPLSRDPSSPNPSSSENPEAATRPTPAVPLILAGTMLGLSHFSRIDSVLVVFAMIASGFLWVIFARNVRECLLFWLAYFITALAGSAVAATQAVSYTLETFRHVNVETIRYETMVIAVVSALTFLALAFQFRRASARITAFLTKHSRLIFGGLFFIIAASVIYGFFVRPVITPPDYEAFHAGDKTIRSYSLPQMTFRWLGWYMTPPALFAAFAGLALLLRCWSARLAPVYFVFGVNCLYFLHALHCTPYHYWGMRRFVPVVIPALFIGLGYFFKKAFDWSLGRRSHLALLCVVGAYILTALFYIGDLRHIFRFNHWKGAIDTLEQIDAAVPDNSRLILESYPGIYLYMPLKNIYDKKVYLMQKKADQQVVENTILNWLNSGESVYFLTYTWLDPDHVSEFRLSPVLHDLRRFPRIEDFVEKKPFRQSRHSVSYYIWKVELR